MHSHLLHSNVNSYFGADLRGGRGHVDGVTEWLMLMSRTLSVGRCETRRLQLKTFFLIYSSGQPELSARPGDVVRA